MKTTCTEPSTPVCPVAPAARFERSLFGESLARIREHLDGAGGESTRALIAAVDARDAYTRTHSMSVAVHAEAIAARMGWSDARTAVLRNAALLHDVGKIGVPDAILTKPGRLTEEEFDAVRRHPEIALDIVGHLSFLGDELTFILHHHERFDGRGYPSGLAGQRIPLGARILAVADSLDTMLSPRTYKPAYPADHVRAELIAESGRQFDPAIVAVALTWLDEFTRIAA